MLIYVTAPEPARTYRTWQRNRAPQLERHKMKINEGVIDRSLRVAVGLLLIGLAFTGTIGAWGYIGLIPLVTGVVGLCPVYSMLGINSCPAKRG